MDVLNNVVRVTNSSSGAAYGNSISYFADRGLTTSPSELLESYVRLIMQDLMFASNEVAYSRDQFSLISKVFDTDGFNKDTISGQMVADRIYALVEAGILESTGNIRRWRESNVRVAVK